MASNVDIYKSQDRPPPGVKRSSTAKTGSSCESLRHLGSAVTTGETTPLLWTIRTVVGVSSGAPLPRVRDSENVPPRGRWHTTAVLVDSPLNESATAVGGRPVHGSRGNAEKRARSDSPQFQGDPEKRRDEDRKYGVPVIPFRERPRKEIGRDEPYRRVSLFRRGDTCGVASGRECFRF